MSASFDRFRKPAASATPSRPAGAGAGTDVALSPKVALVAKERRAQAILASLDNLPTLPAVAMEVLRLSNDATAQASDFESLLRRDQALTAKVLKLVNSPFFGLRNPVTSIPHAIVVLGMRTLRSVVVAAQTSRLLDKQLVPYGFDDGGMWKHSMSCASLTRVLAKRATMGPDTLEELFVGGLLHDVGKVILAPHVAGAQAEFDRVRAACGDVVRAEHDVLGTTHPEIGGAMARKWGLSASLVELIEGHHRPLAEGADRRLLVVQTANEVCNQLGVGRKAGPAEPTAEFIPRVEALGLVHDVTGILEESRQAIESLDGAFRELAR
jgi:putative nucleotidyltransferase with HDIG domain